MTITPPIGIGSSGELPAVNQALEPSWVRKGSKAVQQDYASALAFERTLVEQLSKSMASSTPGGEEGQEEDTGGGEGSGGSSMDAGMSQISSMLPQALSSSVMSSGGLGLAAELTRGLGAAGTLSAAPGTSTPADTGAGTLAASGGTEAAGTPS